jgi:general transcription factor 3C polypeptide 3 (transcription factor C subunit 4)
MISTGNSPFNAIEENEIANASHRNPGEVSDADSDLEELQGDIAKFDESVREFLVSHYGEETSRDRGGPRGRGARGPRKAAKPRGDITARLSKVNQAFLAGDYSRALDLAFEVIRINAETYQAWTAVASIFREQGELDRALSAMVYAAHLRPKDVGGWLGCASFALDVTDRGGGEGDNLHTARLCYSAALRADPSNVEARLGKANVCHQQGHLAAAITDYKLILKHQPYNLDLVRKLAEACVETKHAGSAVPAVIDAYRRFFIHEISCNKQNPSTVYWHDIGIYVELFASTGRYMEGIKELKSMARWLVGRATEQYWEDWQDDDREWDEKDDRRELVPGFLLNRAAPHLYGNSLPLDMRARLAVYRLRTQNNSEGLVSPTLP